MKELYPKDPFQPTSEPKFIAILRELLHIAAFNVASLYKLPINGVIQDCCKAWQEDIRASGTVEKPSSENDVKQDSQESHRYA